MRYVVGGRAKERTAASTSLIGRFETEILTQPKKLETLSFRDRFDILLNKKLSGVAVLKHKSYGKCQFVVFCLWFFGVQVL